MEKLWDEITLTTETWGEEGISKKIGDVIRTLTAEGEVCKVYEDGVAGFYVIQHGHNDDCGDYWGGPALQWLTEEEWEDVEGARRLDESEQEETETHEK